MKEKNFANINMILLYLQSDKDIFITIETTFINLSPLLPMKHAVLHEVLFLFPLWLGI